jgi:putative oxidoreductase
VFARLKQPPTETTYVLLRVVAGLMFSFHGIQKVFGFHAKAQPPIGSQVWIGGVIEVVCGLCIALGVYTRSAAFLASGTMAVAYTQFHWKLDLGERFWPAVNQGELALLYAFLFLFMACRGSGKWALLASDKGKRATKG